MINRSRILQKKLFYYGIIPTLCLTVMQGSLLEAADSSQKKEPLVILEGRQQGKIPEGNLQQKVQSLTAHANVQSERIRVLKDEVQTLKNKLHLLQLNSFSNETGNYKQLYAALKKESALNKETQKKLDGIIQELKRENDAEKQKNALIGTQIIALIGSLSDQIALAENQTDESTSSSEKENYPKLLTALEQEISEHKKIQSHLQSLIGELKNENQTEKQKLAEVESYNQSLLTTLKEQKQSFETLEKNHQNTLASLNSSSNQEAISYKALYLTLEQDYRQNKEMQNELEKLIQSLQAENESNQLTIERAEKSFVELNQQLQDQALAMEKMQQEHQQQTKEYTSTTDEQSQFKILYTALEHELTEHKESKNQLETLVSSLKIEKEADQQKIGQANEQIESLIAKLESQKSENDSDFILKQKHEAELSELQKSWEEERNLSLLAESTTKELLHALEAEFQLTKDSLVSLQNERDEALQKLKNNSNPEQGEILAHLYHTIEADKSFADSYDSKHKKLLSEIKQEKERAEELQKNLNEVQQIYDQTVKLYNDLYVDHNTMQKHFDKVQSELDERKSVHLVEVDDLEAKLELLNGELNQEKNNVQDLKNQLVLLEQNKTNEIQDFHQKNIENLTAQENLLNQALSEIESQKKIIVDQSIILQQVYQDRQSLAAQLQMIPYTTGEVILLSEKSNQLSSELDDLKNSYFQQIDAFIVQEDQLHRALREIEKHKDSIHDQFNVIHKHRESEEMHNELLAEKSEEIQRLLSKIQQTEQDARLQLQQFISNLETERFKNLSFNDELVKHQSLNKRYEDQLDGYKKENETLRDSIATKDQNFLLKKLELDELSEKLKELGNQNYTLAIQLKQAEDHQSQLLDQNQTIQEKDTYIANMEDSFSNLKKALNEKDLLIEEKENASQSLITQRNKFEEKLLAALKENEDLQKLYDQKVEHQNQTHHELEQHLAELNSYKEASERLEKLQHVSVENQQLSSEISSLKLKLEEYENKSDDKTSASLMAQIERLQEALQQTISDKTAIQSLYQDQLVTERVLTERLEETIAELEHQKSKLEKLEQSSSY